jgi:hypothetical protein
MTNKGEINDNNTIIDTGKVVIKGIAYNDKINAAVLTDDEKIYYLDTISQWDEKLNGKRVIVRGILYLNKDLGENSDPNIIKQILGIYWIKNYKWELDSIQ